MARILVTGGAGYVGSHTCVSLLAAGYDVVVVDNLLNSSREAIARVEKISGKQIPFFPYDLRDKEKLESVFAEYTFDAVIHFAGLKAVGESVEKPLYYYQNNLESTLTLCELMEKYKVTRFVFSSSATVYDSTQPMPLHEESGRWCINPYGWTKFMIEQILTDIANANPSWAVMLLRYFNPVGAHPSGLIGEDPADIPNNLMPYISQTAAGRRPFLRVFGNDYPTPDGTGVRDYIHVMDLAEGHVKALAYLEANAGVTAVNLGTGRGVSVLELLAGMERACGHEIPHEMQGRRAGDAAVCYADPKKASELLGWKAERTLDDMCQDSWRWQSANPNGYNK